MQVNRRFQVFQLLAEREHQAGEIVESLQYNFEIPLPQSSCLIVRRTPEADATAPWLLPAEPGR